MGVTRVSQITENDENRVDGFVEYVNDQISSGQFPASGDINIDEMNLVFGIKRSITLVVRGSNTVSVKTLGTAARFPNLLGVTMSGEKLPLFMTAEFFVNGLGAWNTRPVHLLYARERTDRLERVP